MSKSGIAILLLLAQGTLEAAALALPALQGRDVQREPAIFAVRTSLDQLGSGQNQEVLYTECQSTSFECGLEVRRDEVMGDLMMWTDPSSAPISASPTRIYTKPTLSELSSEQNVTYVLTLHLTNMRTNDSGNYVCSTNRSADGVRRTIRNISVTVVPTTRSILRGVGVGSDSAQLQSTSFPPACPPSYINQSPAGSETTASGQQLSSEFSASTNTPSLLDPILISNSVPNEIPSAKLDEISSAKPADKGISNSTSQSPVVVSDGSLVKEAVLLSANNGAVLLKESAAWNSTGEKMIVKPLMPSVDPSLIQITTTLGQEQTRPTVVSQDSTIGVTATGAAPARVEALDTLNAGKERQSTFVEASAAVKSATKSAASGEVETPSQPETLSTVSSTQTTDTSQVSTTSDTPSTPSTAPTFSPTPTPPITSPSPLSIITSPAGGGGAVTAETSGSDLYDAQIPNGLPGDGDEMLGSDSTGLLVGIVLAAVVTAVCAGVVICRMRSRRRKSKYIAFGNPSYNRGAHSPAGELSMDQPLSLSSNGYTVLA